MARDPFGHAHCDNRRSDAAGRAIAHHYEPQDTPGLDVLLASVSEGVRCRYRENHPQIHHQKGTIRW